MYLLQRVEGVGGSEPLIQQFFLVLCHCFTCKKVQELILAEFVFEKQTFGIGPKELEILKKSNTHMNSVRQLPLPLPTLFTLARFHIFHWIRLGTPDFGKKKNVKTRTDASTYMSCTI